MLNKSSQILKLFLVSISIFFGWFSFSNASVIFSDNFDSYTIGYLQLVGSSNWISFLSGNSGRVDSTSPFSVPNYYHNDLSGNIPACYNYDLESKNDIYVKFSLKSNDFVSGQQLANPTLFFSGTDCKYYSEVHSSVRFDVNSDGHIWVYGKNWDGVSGYLFDTGFMYDEGGSVIVHWDKSEYIYEVYGKTQKSLSFPMWSGSSVVTTGNFRLFGFFNTLTSSSSVIIDDLTVSDTFSSFVNGDCGSSSGVTYESIDAINSSSPTLCDSGSVTGFLYHECDTDPSYQECSWEWVCSGSGGGSDSDVCRANWGKSAVCGSLNGVDHSVSIPDYNNPDNLSQYCSSGSLYQFFTGGSGWYWYCKGVGLWDSNVFCSMNFSYVSSVFNPDDLIPDYDNDIHCSDFKWNDFSGFWNCLVSIGAYLVLPERQQIVDFSNAISTGNGRFPFAIANYWINQTNRIVHAAANPNDDFSYRINFTLYGNEIDRTIVFSEDILPIIGQEVYDAYFFFVKVLIYISWIFTMWVLLVSLFDRNNLMLFFRY